MIIKKSEMKSKIKASFKRLYEYLATEKTEENIRSAGIWVSTDEYGVEDIDLFIKDIETTQKMNTSSKDDKTYHVIVSFSPNEKPSYDILKSIETDICKKLGYIEHQRICVAHDDTDNFHFHMAINKINPQTYKIKTPYRDYKLLGDVAKEVEQKYNLVVTNHDRNNSVYHKSNDIDKASFTTSLNNYIKDIKLDDVNDWQSFHDRLAENAIKYVKKGAGAVFGTTDDKIFIKASTVNKELTLGSLEKRFGYFKYNENIIASETKYDKKPKDKRGEELYNQYKTFNIKRKDIIQKNRTSINKEFSKKIQSETAVIQGAMELALLMNMSPTERMLLKMVFNSLLKDKQNELSKEKKTKLQNNYIENQHIRFRDWVSIEAKTSVVAEEYLLKRRTEEGCYDALVGDFSEISKKAVKVTMSGTFIINSNIKITSSEMKIKDYSKILQGLEFFAKYSTEPLKITGNDIFKKNIMDVIIDNNIDIALDKDLQQSLNTYKREKIKESIILSEYTKMRNDKVNKYQQFNAEDTHLYNGFVKYGEQFLLVTKSATSDKNILYIKIPSNEDYKILKGLQKGDEIKFNNPKSQNNTIVEDYITEKKQLQYKYKVPKNEKDLEKADYRGSRNFKGQKIHIYQDGTTFYTKLDGMFNKTTQDLKR